jgi:ribosomal protein S18 acetylase RimI-like enzyme
MGQILLSFMEKNDIPEAARVLSTAMLDNPLHVALFQGQDEKVRLLIQDMFTDLFNNVPGIVFLAREGQAVVGVMRMRSCDGRKIPDAPAGPPDENDLDQRKFIWLKEWAQRDPTDQHWHLGPIGVLPSHQGSGVGSQLMQRFCEEVDACSARAYLETDLDKNVRFYEKFGFEVVATSEIFQVENRYMLRPAMG